MSQVMEKTIVSLLEYEKTCDKFLSQYGELLQIWNNEKAYSRAIIFVKNCLEKTSNTNSLKSLNQAGLDWAVKAKDKRMITFFTDRVSKIHPPYQKVAFHHSKPSSFPIQMCKRFAFYPD